MKQSQVQRLTVVREFDRIICDHKDYSQNHRGFHSFNQIEFDQLRKFILKDDSGDTQSFLTLSSSSNLGYVITVRNYVGMIELPSGHRIQILPKLDMAAKAPQLNEEHILLQMIQYVSNPETKVYQTANLRTAEIDIFEVFISIYIKMVMRLVKEGLRSDYHKISENLPAFKGKLLIKEQIKYNHSHKEHFYVQHDEFGINCPENRIVKAALLLLSRVTRDYNNQRQILQLLPYFENVKDTHNPMVEFNKIIIGRTNLRYVDILNWSRVFLKNQSFTMLAGKENANSLLFRMDNLYERFVAQRLKKLLQNQHDHWKIQLQDQKYKLFDYPRPIFKLRPDIVVQHHGKVIILDTKWKRLANNFQKNYGISQADMYQMYVYAKKYQTSEVYVLYPYVKGFNADSFVFSSNDDVNIHICFLDLSQIDNSLSKIIETFDVTTV
ncbi:McrC family protein [Limosilactobacillus sp. WILCCON 0053]|uniref:McrC family protein n=1 Tax=Limosilactobacillus allomucosae TaxID=3142938 RepID=A0ABV0I979_9LACO